VDGAGLEEAGLAPKSDVDGAAFVVAPPKLNPLPPAAGAGVGALKLNAIVQYV